MAREQNEVRSCVGCGKDTRAKDQICSSCRVGGPSPVFASNEGSGRKGRSPRVIGGTSIVEDDEDLPCDRRSDRNYHGGSDRDDI